MNISVIPIGNSKGIRLGKSLLEKYNIKDAVELILEKDYIIIKPTSSPRKGWDKAFKKMHENIDDKALMADIFDDENLEEWN
jgi:antitoxin MazE